MKLAEVVEQIEVIQTEQEEMREKQRLNDIQLAKLGKAVFQSMKDLAPAGANQVEFQVGTQQYCIEGAGSLKRINEVQVVEYDKDIKVEA